MLAVSLRQLIITTEPVSDGQRHPQTHSVSSKPKTTNNTPPKCEAKQMKAKHVNLKLVPHWARQAISLQKATPPIDLHTVPTLAHPA